MHLSRIKRVFFQLSVHSAINSVTSDCFRTTQLLFMLLGHNKMYHFYILYIYNNGIKGFKTLLFIIFLTSCCILQCNFICISLQIISIFISVKSLIEKCNSISNVCLFCFDDSSTWPTWTRQVCSPTWFEMIQRTSWASMEEHLNVCIKSHMINYKMYFLPRVRFILKQFFWQV